MRARTSSLRRCVSAGTHLLGLWLALALAVACACRKTTDALATLETFEGNVERDRSAKVGVFSPASRGDTFLLGDAVRTGPKARASLRLLDGSSLALEEKTLIRFVAHASPEKSPKLDLEFGQAVVTASGSPLTLETTFGNAVIQPNGTLRFTRMKEGARFEVTVGNAVLDVGDKRTQLSPSSSAEVGADGRLVDRNSAAPPSTASPDRSDPSAEADPELSLDLETEGAKIRDDGQAPFRPLPKGKTRVATGSVVDLPAGVTARLHARKESTRLAGPAQFTIGDRAGTLVKTQGGEIELAPAQGTVSVSVPGGTIRAQVGARAHLRTDKVGTTVSVVSGRVTLDGSGEGETLEGGDEAVLERSGKVRRSRSRGLDYADIVVAAGDSFSVHDPKPPTAVGIGVASACGGMALLDLGGHGRREITGEKAINIELKPGSHSYSIRCLDEAGTATANVVAKGSITVLADSGTRQIAAPSPATFVDVDGRDYTVLYQSKLPSIVARWPSAPSTGPFDLVVRRANGQTKTLRMEKATYTFDPGTLGEGKHVLTFGTTQRRSKPTAVIIVFDNATPAASIVSPSNGGFEAGSQVQVAGMALPSSTVSVNGVDLPQDDQHRFQGSTVAPTAERALAIRFVHPARGTHYYLRRPAGAR